LDKIVKLASKTKEAIKTALAMTIAYGIALSQGWENPYWAGMAVAFATMATIGQTFNKAALRMAGTLLAMLVSLLLIALFPQERWAFFLALTLYGAICTYLMSGSEHGYFWQVAWFVCVIICMDAGPDAVNAFDTAVLRGQETGLGILVYSLVSLFVWPGRSGDFNAAAAKVFASQRQLYIACLEQVGGRVGADRVAELSGQAVQTKAEFDELLKVAKTERRVVWEMRHQWRNCQQQMAALSRAIVAWRETFAELGTLDMPDLLPGLNAFGAELEQRLSQLDRMLAGQAPEESPQSLQLPLDQSRLAGLSHLQIAAVTVTRAQMLELDRLTHALFSTVSAITGFGSLNPAPVTAAPPRFTLPDVDRLANVVRFLLIMWLAWLAVIYVEGLPGGFGLVTISGSLGIVLANMPQVPVTKLFAPAVSGILVAGSLYIFVMPGLSSFMSLGPMIFAVTFGICYWYSKPEQMLGRALGLALFISIASISNEQSYSFLVVSTTAEMFAVLFLILLVTAYFPFNLMPEQVFLRHARRFFRSCDYLVADMQWNRAVRHPRLDHWKQSFHRQEVATLPAKLASMAPHIDPAVLPGTSPAQLQALVTSLESLALQVQELLAVGGRPQARYLVEQLLTDFREWRLRVGAALHRLALDPGAVGDAEASRAALDQLMADLEHRIGEALATVQVGQLSERDEENFYRLLGAYRGASAALIAYSATAVDIDWAAWHEERFA
jgi:uncharacterized membrane protein YccC